MPKRYEIDAELEDVTIGFGGRDYTFRPPAFEDLEDAYQGLPIFNLEGAKGRGQAIRKSLAIADRLLVACALEPRITAERTGEAGTVHVRAIRYQARLLMLDALLEAGGFSLAKADEIRPTQEIVEGSPSSTASDNGTGDGRANSSEEELASTSTSN